MAQFSLSPSFFNQRTISPAQYCSHLPACLFWSWALHVFFRSPQLPTLIREHNWLTASLLALTPLVLHVLVSRLFPERMTRGCEGWLRAQVISGMDLWGEERRGGCHPQNHKSCTRDDVWPWRKLFPTAPKQAKLRTGYDENTKFQRKWQKDADKR